MALGPGYFLPGMVEPLGARGLALEDWIEGLPVEAEQVLGGKPIEFDSVLSMLERAADFVGGYERFEEFIAGLPPIEVPSGLAELLATARTPAAGYEMVARYLANQLSPPLCVETESTRSGLFVLQLTAADTAHNLQVIWYTIRAVLRRLPVRFGLPEGEVETRFSDRSARYEVRAEHLTLLAKLLRVVRAGFVSQRLVREFQDQQRELQQSFSDLERQAKALRASEARNRALVRQLEQLVAERTSELEARSEQLRVVQSQLIQAERLGAAQDLAGSVAHAINNPLTALIGQVQMMLEGSDPPAPGLQRVHQVALRIRDVVTRTLQLFRQGELDLSREDPKQILSDVAASLRPLAEHAGVYIEQKCEAGIPTLEVDGALLRAALGSLAENAVQASYRGTTVELELALVPSMRVIEFRIADTGPGVSPALLVKVFEPFFTTKSGGTGLGLAIAQGVVAGHDGRLRLLPRPGGGTIAAVELPLAADPDGVSARVS